MLPNAVNYHIPIFNNRIHAGETAMDFTFHCSFSVDEHIYKKAELKEDPEAYD